MKRFKRADKYTPPPPGASPGSLKPKIPESDLLIRTPPSMRGQGLTMTGLGPMTVYGRGRGYRKSGCSKAVRVLPYRRCMPNPKKGKRGPSRPKKKRTSRKKGTSFKN